MRAAGIHALSGFNSRSREGSDEALAAINSIYQVSIRAPARGATRRQCLFGFADVVSIRAPARGATDGRLQREMRHAVSIRAPARGATLVPLSINLLRGVSIRAPARGATGVLFGGEFPRDVSIRAPARGATDFHGLPLMVTVFQFALPRGERLSTA